MPDRAVIKRVARLFGPYRKDVTIVALTILVTAGLGVLSPLLIRPIFDKGLFPKGGPNISLLSWLVAALVAIAVVSSVIGVYQSYLTNVVGQRVMRDLRATLYEHLQGLSLRFFTSTKTGEIQSRLANDVGGLQSVITDTASTLLSNSVILISTLIAMFVLSWKLSILSLVLLPLFVVLTRTVGRARRKVAAETQVALAEMSATTEETLSVSGVLLSKVFGRQAEESERYREQNERLAKLQVRQQIIGRSFFAVVGTFFSITPAMVYLVAGLTSRHGGGSRPARWSRSPRCRPGSSCRWASCSRPPPRCPARSRCSTGCSRTWISSPTSSTGPMRASRCSRCAARCRSGTSGSRTRPGQRA